MADKENIDILDRLLDEQIELFPSGIDTFKAKKHLPIKMVHTDIEFLHVNGVNTGIIVCGICTLDNIFYAALCNPTIVPISGYVEEIHLTLGNTQIKSTKLIRDSQEWCVIVDFFQKNNVWELKKIFNWIWAVKNGTTQINKNWIKKLNKKLKVELNEQEIINNSNLNLNAIIKNKTN